MIDGSKSGALLINDTSISGPHYLLWGDTTIKITNNTNSNGNITNGWYQPGITFIKPRNFSNESKCFDDGLVESGPPPILLNDGNYLFFYNSAQNGFPANNTGYHPAFVILNGSNVYHILQRSKCDEPLLSPQYAWEIGSYPYTCNVPNVVFLEAAVKMNSSQAEEYVNMYNNKIVELKESRLSKIINLTNNDNDNVTEYIRVYYGGSDSVIGTAVIQITYPIN